MDDAHPSPAASPRWKWRYLLVASGVAALVLVVAFVFVSRDEPPPDVRDLVRKPLELSDADNAYAILAAAAQSIDASPWASETDVYFDVARGKKWDADRAAVWLAANDHVWPAVVRAASIPSSQGPTIKSLTDPVDPSADALRQLTELARIRAQYLARTGRPQEAFEWLTTYLHAARRISDSNSLLLVWLTGMSAQVSASQTLDTIIAQSAPSPETGRTLIQALEDIRPSPGALAMAIGNEHVMMQLLIEQLRPGGAQPPMGNQGLDAMLSVGRVFPLVFKPHRTQRLHAEYFRKVIDLIDADWPTLRTASSSLTADLLGAGGPQWNPNNIAGRALLGDVTPNLQAAMVKRLRTQSAISATQALIALRLYEIEHGTLPEKLSDLVPQYLPKVPLDYFDRAPLRYSREFRAVWSVGKNNLTITTPDPKVDSSEVYLKVPAPER
ncbi:MAG: hypothetical protein NTV51_27585 [Verrucomicrobia bacterium]|nr:hypothetical protein [Verrucomicrobiota bacterium]